MVRPRPWLVTLLAGALAWTSRASAAPDDLEWSAPRECPSKGEIAARVGRLIGPDHPLRAALRARSVVSKDDRGGFHADVSLAADPGGPARHIDGDSCEAVSDAIVLILAIAVAPDAAIPADATRATEEASPSIAPVAPAQVAEERSAPEPASADRPRPFAVTGAGVVDSGLFGVVTPGAEVALGLRASHVSLDVAGTWLSTTRATLADRPSEGSSVSALQLIMRGCGVFGGGRLTAGPCVGTGVSWISAHGFGAMQSADRGATLLLGVAGGRASYRLASAVAVWAELDAVLAAQRPTFVIDNAGAVAQVPFATARLAAGVEMRF